MDQRRCVWGHEKIILALTLEIWDKMTFYHSETWCFDFLGFREVLYDNPVAWILI